MCRSAASTEDECKMLRRQLDGTTFARTCRACQDKRVYSSDNAESGSADTLKDRLGNIIFDKKVLSALEYLNCAFCFSGICSFSLDGSMHAVAQRQLEIEQQQAHEAHQQQCQKFNHELGKAQQKVSSSRLCLCR